ncbi:MAG: flagellar biosynthetic protein FliO [Pseudomonadota bacterium]
MMVEYFIRLALLLPLLGLLIWGSLKLTKYLQGRMVGAHNGARAMQLLETSLLAPGIKLAVVRFHDRDILIGCSRQGLVRLGESDARQADMPADDQAIAEPV